MLQYCPIYLYYNHLLLTVCGLISSSPIGSSTICCPFCKKQTQQVTRNAEYKYRGKYIVSVLLQHATVQDQVFSSPYSIKKKKKSLKVNTEDCLLLACNATLALTLMYYQTGWSHRTKYIKQSSIWSLTTTQLDVIFPLLQLQQKS